MEKQVSCAEFFAMPERLTQGEAKPTNPKDIVATTKLPLHLVPMITQAYLAIGHFNGLGKYGRDNWRASGVLASIYTSAAKRHIDSWFEGEELDPDDKVPHLMGAITSLSILIDAQHTGVLNDDRKYRGAGIPAQVRGLAEAHIARLALTGAQRWPMDLRLSAFPVGMAARTPLYHMSMVLMRVSDQGFRLMLFRSMARTAWHEISVALKTLAARAA